MLFYMLQTYPNIKSAVINDINPDLTLCYQVVRDNPTELIKSLNAIQSILAMEPAWVKKDIDLDVELERADYLGKEPMLRHVWDNLISNAIKFSPKGGCVRIRLAKEATSILVSIEDQGPGLSEETKKHMFDKFYQADTSHKQEGNGLGLALVKRILIMEKGQVAAENLPEGGCRFTVTLQAK